MKRFKCRISSGKMEWACKVQQGLRREKTKQWFSPCNTYAKFYSFPGAAMQVAEWTAVLNPVKYLYEINWNYNGTVMLQLWKSNICFSISLPVGHRTWLSFHTLKSIPSSAGRKEGAGPCNIFKIFPSSITQDYQHNAHKGHGVCLP